MQRTKWTERKFTFDFPAGWMPNILERLHGTPARLIDMTLLLSNDQLSHKPGDKWSIKEQVGHLIDLENLHEGRIRDFLDRKPTLRAADMSNIQTYQAGHNAKDINDLISQFSARREQFVEHLENLDDETLLYTSMHPRLQVPMRPVDLAYFTAEHDDHHLATIRELLKGF